MLDPTGRSRAEPASLPVGEQVGDELHCREADLEVVLCQHAHGEVDVLGGFDEDLSELVSDLRVGDVCGTTGDGDEDDGEDDAKDMV